MNESYDIVVSAIKPGDVVAGYTIVKTLGVGGMGKVFLAEDQVTGNQVAIKMLYGAAASNASLVARFKKEAAAVKKIGGRAFVRALQFGAHEQRPYIVMEFLDGASLGDVIKLEHRIAVGRASHILIQVARALHAAHQQGIIHRDVKPDNIFLLRGDTQVEEVKMLDLGIAKHVEDEGTSDRTQSAVVMGTPHTMSPEQCLSSTKIDHRADVYSLGVVAYYMLSGVWPFDCEGFGGFIVAHVQTPPPPLRRVAPWVPEEMEQVVHRCLEKSAAARYQNMEELAAALAPLADVTMPLPANIPTVQAQKLTTTTHSGSSGEMRPATQTAQPASTGPNRFAYVALALVVTGLAATGTLFVVKSRPTAAKPPEPLEAPAAKPTPPTETTPAAQGRVLVTTAPSGATVSIDGRAKGQSPLLLTGKPGETIQVLLSLDGHEERVVPVLIGDADRKAEFRMTPVAVAPEEPKSKTRSDRRSDPSKAKSSDKPRGDYMSNPFEK